jgi:hypothetical protein
MGKGLSFAVGLGKGLIEGKQYNDRKSMLEEDRKMRSDEHNLRMEEAERVKGDRAAITRAAAPVTMEEGAGGMIRPASADNRDVGLPNEPGAAAGGLEEGGFRVGGKTFTDKTAATGAAEQANSPEAKASRISMAMEERGNPVGAMEFQQKAMQFADQRWDRSLRSAMAGGHEGLAGLMTTAEAGPFKGKQVRAVPDPDGKTVTYHVMNPDGTSQPTPYKFANNEDGVVQAGYKLSRIAPEVRYRNMIDEDKREAAARVKERELELKERELREVKIPNAETRAALADVRTQLADLKMKGGGKGGADATSKEERLRWTSLHSETGRRLSEAQKAYNTLATDPVFMVKAKKPGTPEAAQLDGLRGDLEQYKADRSMFAELLGGSQAADARAKREPAAGGAGAAPAPAAAPAAAPGKKPQAQPGSSRDNPVAVADRAAHAKLPKGTYFKAPDGQTYIKQ